MRASELVRLLNAAIVEHGDKKVFLNVQSSPTTFYPCESLSEEEIEFNFGATCESVLVLHDED